MVASPGKYIAIASTTAQTNDPVSELTPAFNLLGKILERYWLFSCNRILMLILTDRGCLLGVDSTPSATCSSQ